MSGPYRERVFTPAEVRKVLRRAAELEDAKRPPRGAGRSHTLGEIEQIARDAGISEDAVGRALAGEIGPEAPPKRAWSFAGAPGRISIERTVRGKTNAAVHGKLAKAMRGAIGQLGKAQAMGDSLTWSSSTAGGLRNVYAIVEPEGEGQVAVRVEENLANLRGGLFGGVLGGVGGGGLGIVVPLAAAFWPAGIPLAIVAWVFLLYVMVRALYVNRFTAREAELRAIVDQVAASVEAQGGGVDAAEEPARGARIAPTEEAAPELDEDEDEDVVPGPARRAGR